VPFKDGLICLGNPLLRIQIVLLDGAGAGSTTISIVTKGGVAPGDTRYYQEWYRDPTGACGLFSNLTNALIVDWE